MRFSPIISVLFLVIAPYAFASDKAFKYSCDVRSSVYFDSFDLSFSRPENGPDELGISQPVITKECKIIIPGLRRAIGTLIATAEGPPHNFFHLSIQARLTPFSTIKVSLLEDPESQSAWGFGKYNEEFLFIFCERFPA